MSGPDWYRWYPSKWLSGTLGLTLEQRAVYVQIINVILDRGECPDDERYLQRICGCDVRVLRRVLRELLAAGKLEHLDAKYVQHRADIERKSAEHFVEMQRKRASKRWENNDIGDANAGTCKPQPQKKERVSDVTESPTPASTEPPSHNRPADAGRVVRFRTPSRFPQLWQMQRLPGQKRGKGVAEKVWAKIERTEPPERVNLIIEAFGKHQSCWERYGWEVSYIPHLATWLNQRRWEDDLPRPRGETGRAMTPKVKRAWTMEELANHGALR